MQITSTRIEDSGRLVGDIIQFGLTETSKTAFVIDNPTANVTTPAGTLVDPAPIVVVDPTGSVVSHDMYINLSEATAGLYTIGWLYNVGAQQVARLENIFVTWTVDTLRKMARLTNSSTLTQEDADTAMYQSAMVTPGISDLPADMIINSYSSLIPADRLKVDEALILLSAAWLNGFTKTEVPTGSLIASVRGTDETRWASSTRSQNPLSLEEIWAGRAYELLSLTSAYGAHYANSTTGSIELIQNRHKTIVRSNDMYNWDTIGSKPSWRRNPHL